MKLVLNGKFNIFAVKKENQIHTFRDSISILRQTNEKIFATFRLRLIFGPFHQGKGRKTRYKIAFCNGPDCKLGVFGRNSKAQKIVIVI